MKKAIQFLEMPFIQILIAVLSLICLFSDSVVGLRIMPVAALIIYIFPGGFLFSKIESKKIRVSSAIFTAVLLILAHTAFMIADNYSDMAMYAAIMLSPFTTLISGLIFEKILVDAYVWYKVTLVVTSVFPVIVIVLSAKLYNLKKSK